MKIDHAMLERLAKQNDDELWRSIVSMASTKGFRLPEATPKQEDMNKIRAMMLHPEKVNLPQVIRLLKQYKQGG